MQRGLWMILLMRTCLRIGKRFIMKSMVQRYITESQFKTARVVVDRGGAQQESSISRDYILNRSISQTKGFFYTADIVSRMFPSYLHLIFVVNIFHMAGMLQEEHPFIMMYTFVLKIYLVYTFSWIDFSSKFNGTCFFGSIMDLIVRKCWKISKKG